MQVFISSHDQETAQKVRASIAPLCDALATFTTQDMARLSIAPGVLVAEIFARDGTRATVPVGLRALSAALTSPDSIRRYAAQLVLWATRKQNVSRMAAAHGIWTPS